MTLENWIPYLDEYSETISITMLLEERKNLAAEIEAAMNRLAENEKEIMAKVTKLWSGDEIENAKLSCLEESSEKISRRAGMSLREEVLEAVDQAASTKRMDAAIRAVNNKYRVPFEDPTNPPRS